MKKPDDKLKIYQPEYGDSINIPLTQSGVHAGFPSQADDYLEGSLNLNDLVVKHPEATFFARVEGDSMKDACIEDGDLVVVDKAVAAYDGCIAVVYIDQEFALKRIKMEKDRVLLLPANSKYKPIEITPDNKLSIWGVVGYVVKKT